MVHNTSKKKNHKIFPPLLKYFEVSKHGNRCKCFACKSKGVKSKN